MGDPTLENVLVLGTVEMLGEKFDAQFGELAEAANFDDDAVKTWLGLSKDINTLLNYELEDASGTNKFILYLADGDELEESLADANTYLMFIKDVTNNKHTKFLLKQAKDSSNKTLSEIANDLSAAGTVTKSLLEYNAISEEMDELREEIGTNQVMSEAEKREANAKIDELERDKQRFLVTMTAITVMTTTLAAASAPFMISVLVAGYSSIAPYFWEHRVGMIKGCDPIDGAFAGDHGIPLTQEHVRENWSRICSNSGKYYLAEDIVSLSFYNNDNSSPIDVSLCLHGHDVSFRLDVGENTHLHLCDCQYTEDQGTVSGGNANGISVDENATLDINSGIIGSVSNYGGTVTISRGALMGKFENRSEGTLNISGGIHSRIIR